jgi:hypothetical protein
VLTSNSFLFGAAILTQQQDNALTHGLPKCDDIWHHSVRLEHPEVSAGSEKWRRKYTKKIFGINL